MYSPARNFLFGLVGIEAPSPPPVVLRDTVYVDRPFKLPADTAEPEYITIYRDTTIYIDRVVEIRIPSELSGGFVLAAPSPLTITPGKVIFSYYQPERGRFESATYIVPEKSLEAYVDTYFGTFPNPELGLEIGIEYRLLGAFIRAGSNVDGEGTFLGGIRFRLSRFTR